MPETIDIASPEPRRSALTPPDKISRLRSPPGAAMAISPLAGATEGGQHPELQQQFERRMNQKAPGAASTATPITIEGFERIL